MYTQSSLVAVKGSSPLAITVFWRDSFLRGRNQLGFGTRPGSLGALDHVPSKKFLIWLCQTVAVWVGSSWDEEWLSLQRGMAFAASLVPSASPPAISGVSYLPLAALQAEQSPEHHACRSFPGSAPWQCIYCTHLLNRATCINPPGLLAADPLPCRKVAPSPIYPQGTWALPSFSIVVLYCSQKYSPRFTNFFFFFKGLK